MEIHKIEICNLNSLKGEFCIDFMSGNLKGQDIFAITGATGSGKSTILDAITLALYNRVPRLDGKKGENSPKSQDPYKRLKPGDTENTLSRGEKKGYAKVVFEVGGQLYRGEWFCELKNLNFGGSHSLYRLKKEAGVEKAETLVSGNLVHEFDANGFPKDKNENMIDIRLIFKNGQKVIRIRDNCVSFDPLKYLELHETDDPTKHFGIRMVMKMVKNADFVYSLGMNNLTLVL